MNSHSSKTLRVLAIPIVSLLVSAIAIAQPIDAPKAEQREGRNENQDEYSSGTTVVSSTATYVDKYGWAAPDYVKLQTGGFLGAFTGFAGYSFLKEIFNVQVGYGYTPPLSGASHIHIGAAVGLLRPLRFRLPYRIFLVPLYVGGGGMISDGTGLFVKQPSVYPSGYYPPNALHALLLAGIEIGTIRGEREVIHIHSLFAEFVAIDQYLGAIFKNKEARLLNAFSTSLGYRATF